MNIISLFLCSMGELSNSNNTIYYKKLAELINPKTEKKVTRCKVCECKNQCTFERCNLRKNKRICSESECDLLKGFVLINLLSYCFNKNESPVKCLVLRKKQS